jgi:hypothetical protein
VTECNDVPFCNKADPGYVYKCGVPVEQCGSLEQCSISCGGDAGGFETADACAANCVNPCRDTLGQNTSNGCEFYAVEMDLTEETHGSCYAVFVVNQWQTGQPARLEVDLDGVMLPIEQFARIPSGTGTNIVYSPFSESDGLKQNQVAILFLSRDANATPPEAGPTAPGKLANCPPGVIPAVTTDAALHGTGSAMPSTSFRTCRSSRTRCFRTAGARARHGGDSALANQCVGNELHRGKRVPRPYVLGRHYGSV